MRRTPPKTRKAHRFTSNANFFNFLGSKPIKPSYEEIDEVAKGLKNVSNFKKLSNHSKLEKYQDMMTHLAAQNNAQTDLLDIVGRARIARDKERSRRRKIPSPRPFTRNRMQKKRQLSAHKDLNNSNHPFINSFNGLKGVYSPPYTERSQQIQNMINRRDKDLKNRSDRHEHLKQIRRSFINRKTGENTRDKEFKHPYEKYIAKDKVSNKEARESMKRLDKMLNDQNKEAMDSKIYKGQYTYEDIRRLPMRRGIKMGSRNIESNNFLKDLMRS